MDKYLSKCSTKRKPPESDNNHERESDASDQQNKKAKVAKEDDSVLIPKDISQQSVDKPAQPVLREYPKHSEGKSHPRAFIASWYDKYDWAEYSQEKDAMFCYACRHFMPPGYGNAEAAFTKNGFRRWKKAHGKDGGIEKHIQSQCHKMSVVTWKDYERNKANKTSVEQQLNENYQKKVCENRHYIKTIGEIILLTATQNMAQRGHREGDDIANPGNVRKILRFTAKHDPIVAERVKHGPENEKYTSTVIQNEIIDTLASMVLEEIVDSVKQSHYFSIQADEAKDVRKTEQLSLVIRFFDENAGSIEECFITFMAMEKLDAETMTHAILNRLQQLGLDYKSSLIGMGFDGASVMSGRLSGVQKRIRDEAPLAYYVHCYGHRLNLVLVDAAKAVPAVSDFFCVLENLYIFMSNSIVHEKFVKLQHEMFPGEQVRELQHLSDTRWWCRAQSCTNALLRLPCIMRVLRETASEDTGSRAVTARGLICQLDNELVCLLFFFADILGKVNKVSEQLQAKGMDLGSANKLVMALRDTLKEIRQSSLSDTYKTSVEEMCKKCDIPLQQGSKRKRSLPQHLEDYAVMERVGHRSTKDKHIHILYPVLDCIISEVENRFSSESSIILNGLSALTPDSESFLSETYLTPLLELYNISSESLRHELHLVRKMVNRVQSQPGTDNRTISTLLEFLVFICPYKIAFDCLYNLLCIAVTLPVTSASCERSFSKMKLIKTYLRNSMSSERLSNLALLAIENSRAETLDLESFVDEFDSRHENLRIKLH